MAKVIKLTDDGLKKLEEELEYLKTEGRADIAEKIKVARGYGDLSENSEYDEAKNEQAKIKVALWRISAEAARRRLSSLGWETSRAESRESIGRSCLPVRESSISFVFSSRPTSVWRD